jgi:hypothetical protein
LLKILIRHDRQLTTGFSTYLSSTRLYQLRRSKGFPAADAVHRHPGLRERIAIYQSGSDNEFATEPVEGFAGRPELASQFIAWRYAEQVSGTAFTASRAAHNHLSAMLLALRSRPMTPSRGSGHRVLMTTSKQFGGIRGQCRMSRLILFTVFRHRGEPINLS